LELAKGVASFESNTVDAPTEEISNSLVIIDFILNVIPSAEPMPWLRKQRLVIDDKPTVGGVLLFADEPQAILPKRSGIKIYQYATKDDVGTRETLVSDPITIEGHLYSQILKSVDRTVDLVENLK